MSDRDILFYTYDLRGTCDEIIRKAVAEIESYEADYLFKVSLDDVAEHLFEKHSLEPPSLITENIELCDKGEISTQVHDYGRLINVKKSFYEFAIPFSGEKELFLFKASTSTFNPPSGRIVGKELRLRYFSTDYDANALRRPLDKDISTIQEHIGWLRNDVVRFNGRLKGSLKEALEKRKQKLLKDQGMLASLGIPIRQRKDAPLTYVTPVKKRKIILPKPTVLNEPYEPEPQLDAGIYEEILKTLRNMVFVMERSPSAFADMGEEDLRTHFLVQLNGLYEGQATGETFNFDGKTDILIREKGKNIFIAECKFWKGPKGLKSVIDQLLGYLSWRDTKVAILLFNRNKDLSRVLSQIPDAIEKHPNFKRFLKYNKETEFRFILHSAIDKNRELIVTLMVFDIPGKTS